MEGVRHDDRAVRMPREFTGGVQMYGDEAFRTHAGYGVGPARRHGMRQGTP